VAERCAVSLDWLVLGRGVMDWRVTELRRTAKVRLCDAVYRKRRRRLKVDRADEVAADALRALDGLGNTSEALWQIVVDEAAELPSIENLAAEFRDDA
jgi:hypothetical protein